MAEVMRLLVPVEQQESYLCEWLLHTLPAGREWQGSASSVRGTPHGCPKIWPEKFVLMKNKLFSVGYKCDILFFFFQKHHLTHWRIKSNSTAELRGREGDFRLKWQNQVFRSKDIWNSFSPNGSYLDSPWDLSASCFCCTGTVFLALVLNKMLDSIKCVLVGDSAVGKTSLLVRFISDTFPDNYRPTVYENTGVDVFMDGVQISLGLWDTSGSDAFKGIRPLSYQQADVVLMCYSVANHNSFLNLRSKWIGEIRNHLPRVPVLVVATQTDQRESGPYHSSCISSMDGKRLAQDVRAKGYLECSALSNRGVQQVFEYAVRTAVNQAKRQNRRKLFSINECKIFWGLPAVVLPTFVVSAFAQRCCGRDNGSELKTGGLLPGPWYRWPQ